jgi:hypothetical protein
MSEKPLPFVITDRRKFNTDGEPRPDADPTPERETSRRPAEEAGAVQSAAPAHAAPVTEMPAPRPEPVVLPVEQARAEAEAENDLPPAPTAEQMEQSRLAFNATADRIDMAIRAANPGADHPPAMSFEQLVQSVYMQAILQLGGGTRQGEQPQVDLLGARQSIDMLGVLDDKTKGNLSDGEKNLLASALFELRLAFLEITQALARSAQQRQPGGPGMPPPPGRPGPSIVR